MMIQLSRPSLLIVAHFIYGRDEITIHAEEERITVRGGLPLSRIEEGRLVDKLQERMLSSENRTMYGIANGRGRLRFKLYIRLIVPGAMHSKKTSFWMPTSRS
jgi:hypothetical protein